MAVELGAELPGPDAGLPGWSLPPAHRMRVWLVRVVSGRPAPIEAHDELRTLPAGHWRDVDWLPGDVPIVEALIAWAAADARADARVAAPAVPAADGVGAPSP